MSHALQTIVTTRPAGQLLMIAEPLLRYRLGQPRT